MRIPQLTFTRFIAAFLIVGYHFGKIVYPFSIQVLKPLVANLNVLVSYFFILSGFVGGGLVFAGVTDFCGMGLLLAKLPWNKRTPA